jgi:Immunity protein 7
VVLEYHGWATIRDTTEADADADEAALQRGTARIRTLMSEYGPFGLLDLRWLNGTPFLTVAGHRDRRSAEGAEAVRLLAMVGRVAPASYGLLHLRDDEDVRNGGGFRVFRLAGGEVTEHAEVLLSARTVER